MPEQPAPRAVPPFDRIIHIGAPKCGSTTLQALWHANRAELERAGVHYAGDRAHSWEPAKAVSEVPEKIRRVIPSIKNWTNFLGEVRKSTSRLTLISSEWYTSAHPHAIERIVADLDRDRLHAVLVIRPIAKTLPSAWQQLLKFGWKESFAEWLTMLLGDEGQLSEGARTRRNRIWHKHRYDAVAQRWVDVLGPDRVTVIIADDRDRQFVVNAFSKILGVDPERLTAPPPKTNPSLSRFEAEVLLRLNQTYAELGGQIRTYRKLMWRTFDGYVNHLQDKATERTPIPAELVAKVEQAGAQIAQGINASGAHVLGDIGLLTQSVADGSSVVSEEELKHHTARVESASKMMVAMMVTTGILQPKKTLPGFAINPTLLRHQLVAMAQRALYIVQLVRERQRKRKAR